MDYTENSKTEVLDWLKANLTEERLEHSIGCAECAVELAKMFSLDETKAYTAGILHDCAKCFSKETLFEMIHTCGYNLEENECVNYKTLHAPVSAYIAKKQFKVTDEEILSSIRWHTLGKLKMSDFDKIIFLADKIEPKTRDKEFREKILELLKTENGLNKALLKCYKDTIKSLVIRNLKICKTTIDIYNQLQDEV